MSTRVGFTALLGVALAGCALPILSRKTVIDPEPAPMCKIEKAPEYKTPTAGPLASGHAPASSSGTPEVKK